MYEYVGEFIDEEEVKRRIDEFYENNISNYYMFILDKNRYRLYIFLLFKKKYMFFEWGKKLIFWLIWGKLILLKEVELIKYILISLL